MRRRRSQSYASSAVRAEWREKGLRTSGATRASIAYNSRERPGWNWRWALIEACLLYTSQFFALGDSSSNESSAKPTVPEPTTESEPRTELQLVRAKIQELTQLMGADTVAQLLALFKTETERGIAKAQEQLQAGDLDGLRKTAHRLAGAVLGVGAEPLALQCIKLQDVAHSGNQDAAGPLLSQIVEHAGRVLAQL